MREHPVLPDLTPAQGLHTTLTVAVDVTTALTGALVVAAAVALIMTGGSVLTVLVVVLTAGLAVALWRLRAARQQLERGLL